MSSQPPTHSIVEYFYPPESKGHRCGYCKSSSSNFSHGMWAHTLSPENYENLINIGWRRSGCYVYKPMNEKVCCPMYTIRNTSTCVEVSRSQRKVLKRFRKYLVDGVKGKTDGGKHGMEVTEEGLNTGEVIMDQVPEARNPTAKSSKDSDGESTSVKPKKNSTVPPKQVAPVPQETNPRKPHPLKKKHLRRERKRQKLIAKGLDPEEFFKRNERNRVAELDNFFKNEDSYKLRFTTKLVKVDGKEFEKYFGAEHKLYQKYQMHTHGDTESECKASQYRRFLCDNPFGGQDDDDEDSDDDSPPQGTYHQHYYVNNELIAVGVLDILPHCVSSVYFFYDPEYSFLSPGTLGALHEISFVNQLNRTNPAIKYYYLGFYIHGCVKMRYKRKFKPCELVCPVTYEWVGFDERVVGVLDREGYAVLSERGGDGEKSDEDVERVLLLYQRRVYTHATYPNKLKDAEELQSYANLVTSRVASNMLLYRSSNRD